MCPPRYGYAPMVPHVTQWGNGVVPMGYANGGMVDESHINIPEEVLKKGDKDRVFARLMPGELIIPKKHVSMISQLLKERGIKLNGM